jgi:hypothetical protein
MPGPDLRPSPLLEYSAASVPRVADNNYAHPDPRRLPCPPPLGMLGACGVTPSGAAAAGVPPSSPWAVRADLPERARGGDVTACVAVRQLGDSCVDVTWTYYQKGYVRSTALTSADVQYLRGERPFTMAAVGICDIISDLGDLKNKETLAKANTPRRHDVLRCCETGKASSHGGSSHVRPLRLLRGWDLIWTLGWVPRATPSTELANDKERCMLVANLRAEHRRQVHLRAAAPYIDNVAIIKALFWGTCRACLAAVPRRRQGPAHRHGGGHLLPVPPHGVGQGRAHLHLRQQYPGTQSLVLLTVVTDGCG